MCRLFADHGRFEIAGASADKPIAIRAESLADFRPWLAMMAKVFRLTDYHLISLVIEGARISAHWRVNIFSKVTGVTVPTELVDLLEIRDDRIQSYSEFFVSALRRFARRWGGIDSYRPSDLQTAARLLPAGTGGGFRVSSSYRPPEDRVPACAWRGRIARAAVRHRVPVPSCVRRTRS